MQLFLKNRSSGQAALLFVSVLCAVGFIILTSSLDVFVRDYNYKARDYNQVLLDEMTASSFAVMEAALERRLWEPPPDSSCMKSKDFSVSGTLPEGVSWEVKATYDNVTKNFQLVANGEYKGLTSQFKKKIKVMDVSDYLLFTTKPDSVYLDRLYSGTAPTALIARDRRIYTKGPLVLGANIVRPNSKMDWNGSPAIFPAEWGTIIQGDRMQFGGGLYYRPYLVPKPNPDSPPTNIESLLAPYSNAFDAPQTHYSQFGGGSTIITKDYTKAITLKDQVIAAGVGPLTKASLQRELYPIALFGGTPPLQAWSASDSGTYFNDIDRYSIFYYSYADENKFGVRIDATCLSRVDAFDTKKYCSHSEHFPRGFEQWRKNAGLEGYLFTGEATEVVSPTLTWDNMAALEEDAQTCGAVISTPVSPYTDCPIWDANFIKKYATTGDTNLCLRTSSIDLDNLTLSNFNLAAVNDPSNTDNLLRRVIYIKGPSEIKQIDARGLMLSKVSDDAARQKLPIWIVSEDLIALKGYQADTTSPLDVNPGKLREVVFNEDASGALPASQKSPLNITVFSPEQVHLLSPFYVPVTPSHMTRIYPSSGGRLRPIRHILTDWELNENDGFKYGYRRYKVRNVSLVASQNTNSSAPFFLRGLWSGPDSSASQFPSNQCMVSLAGQTLIKTATQPIQLQAQLPSYHSMVDSPIPPPSSRYYNGKSEFPFYYVPDVFNVQRTAPENNYRDQSDVVLTGITIETNFSNESPPGKRDLSTPLYAPFNSRGYTNLPIDIAHKHFTWDTLSYYKTKTSAACIPDEMEYRTPPSPSHLTDKVAANISLNHSRQVYIQESPGDNYRQLGSILGIDQLVIETKAKQ